MKMKKLRLICLTLALCVCTLAAVFVLSDKDSVTAKTEVNAEIAEKYSVGDVLEFPNDLTIQVGDKKYDVTNVYLIFPDGTAHAADSAVLSNAGKYEAVFESEADGKIVSAKKSFRVVSNLISFENDKSTVSYGEMNNNWAENYKNGLKVSLSESDTMKYARPINLYEKEITDIITMNVLQRDVVADVGQMAIRLTDVYDSSNYIEITYKSDPAANVNFLRASANGGASIGLNTGSAGDGVTVRGQKLVKDRNGTTIASNWYQNKTEEAKKFGPTWNNFTIYLDNTNPEKPCISVRQTNEYNKTNAALDKIVAEFNNSDLFAYEFDGFTTGEVWLTVTASSYGNGTAYAPIEIGCVAGEFGESLNVVEYEDLTPPAVSFDLPSDHIKIFTGCPVKIPVPSVYDASGIKGGAADYSVWFKLRSSNPKIISYKNGEFVPSRLGDYTVVYTATDFNGNVTTKEIVLNATEAAESGKLGVGLNYTPIGAKNAGDVISFSGVSADSLNGEAKVEIRVTAPNGVTETVNAADDYIIRSVGNYKVEYVCSDIIYNCVYTDEFTAADAGQYGFDAKKIIMPEYVIKGAGYSLNHVNLVKYTAGGNLAAEYDAYVINDGGAPVKCDPFEVVITASNSVRFRLVAKNDATKVVESDELKVVDVNYSVKNDLALAKYFIGGYDGSKAEGKTYTAYVKNASGSSSLDFINPLVTEYFSFTYEVPISAGNYSVALKLRGYADRNDSVELKLGEDANGSYYEVGGKTERISGTLSGSSTQVRYSVEGAETYLYVSNGNGVNERILVTKALLSDYCLFSLTASGVNSFYVYQVGNQSFSSVNNFDDVTVPYLIADEADPVAKIGSTFKTCIPVYGDVLTPSVAKNCKLTVYLGDDIYVANDGTEFDGVPANRVYDIRLDKYGEYLFSYSFTDGKSNRKTAPFIINVLDDVSPEITVTGETDIKIKAGQTVVPPTYKVTDNVSDAENIIVTAIVYDYRGMLVSASRIDKKSDGSYTFNKAGKYTVYLYCRDEVGNSTFATYTVTVE